MAEQVVSAEMSPQEEIAALVAFMESMTDDTFITDEKFSDPFLTNGL